MDRFPFRAVAGVRPADSPGEVPPTVVPSCGRVRVFLASLARGSPDGPDSVVWEALASRHAIGGSRDRPAMTPESTRVLHELEVRADRVDGLPLDAVAEELGAGIASMDAVAERAEYFIAELGPVPPVEVLPFLRVVAASLAGRPEPADDLVEEFKNAWGSMEVLGGTPDDRLLGAELIAASGIDQGSFYSPLMNVVDRLRAEGCPTPVSTGVLLELRPASSNGAGIDQWVAARRRTGSDQAASLLAVASAPDRAIDAWTAWTQALGPGAAGRPRAAAYLAGLGLPTPDLVARVRAMADRWAPRFRDAALAAAVAAPLLPYSSTEAADWLDKSVAIATARQLAPASGELAVIGLALLRGAKLPGVRPMVLTEAGGDLGLAAHTALHAGLFRDSRGPTPGR